MKINAYFVITLCCIAIALILIGTERRIGAAWEENLRVWEEIQKGNLIVVNGELKKVDN